MLLNNSKHYKPATLPPHLHTLFVRREGGLRKPEELGTSLWRASGSLQSGRGLEALQLADASGKAESIKT